MQRISCINMWLEATQVRLSGMYTVNSLHTLKGYILRYNFPIAISVMVGLRGGGGGGFNRPLESSFKKLHFGGLKNVLGVCMKAV